MLKKFGKKITKKGLLIAGGIAIALVAVIIAIAIVLSKGEATKKKNFTPDSELARAMTYDQFTDADSSVDGTDYVKFGAFFLRDINNDGYAEKIKGTCKQVGKEDTLYMELNVLTNGYLENGVITINSDNFYLQTAIPKDNEIKDNVISNNTKQISLNQINNGTQKLLTGIVRTGDYSYDSQKFAAIGNDTTKYSKINSVTLTGTHVAADGTRTQINKTVEFNMDWYGTTRAEIPSYIIGEPNLNQSKDNTNVVDEENKQVVFEFDIGMQETNNQLILSKAHLEGTIPQLNGYDPAKVEIVDSNAIFTYDEASRAFQVEKLTELNEDGIVKIQCYDGTDYENRYNKFKLKVTYSLDAYNAVENETAEIKIPVSGYYEGYNNTNTEFRTPYRSNVPAGTIVLTYAKPTGSVARFSVRVGKYINQYSKYIISKKNPLKIYNEISMEETDDLYIVNWYGATGSNGNTIGMTMKETKDEEAQVSDQFIKADSTTESMENITTNVGIYFGNSSSLLGENGWIKVYDEETGNLLHEFTKVDWNKYTSNNPYKYDISVKHVKIVTSETEANKAINIYHVKKLDDEYITENYTREQFDNLKYIKSTLSGYIGEDYINTDTHNANYEAPYSLATISLSKTAISTQETEKNMQIIIDAVGNENANQEKWQNGVFLLKLPKDIVDIDISSVLSNNSIVKVISYEVYEENGEKFVKIITSNETPTVFTLTINCNITPDPRIATTTESFELYSSNENGSDYYNAVEDIYDVNGNLNKIEKVNKSVANISLMSPNSLLTNQVATNYDENGSTVVAPQIAVVSKERRSATVNVEINNNYSSTISEVKILGRVPFEGNKYAINGQDMGSTFTATMTNEGIQLPTALKDVAKVYYSTNGEATQDLSDSGNGWTQTPSDYSKVKSYLIDLSDHQLVKGEKHSISYNISIPAGLVYNKVAYSHHAVYFSLDTVEGKYRTQTEPNKIGFMIAKQYDLELTKYQKGKSKIVSGATYAVYEDGNEEAKTRVTGVDGKLTLTGLYIDKTYVVKEVKSPDDYELNEEVVKFTTSESDGKLNVTKTEGTVKNIQAVQPTATEGYKVQLEVEDEVKVRLKIKKTEKGTTISVNKVSYKLTGTGMSKSISTNVNGEAVIDGLKVGEEYTLEETKANGYYISKEKIKFTITNTNGTYTVNVSEGTVKSNNITIENDIPIVNISLEDEKIPTYDLEITKIKKVTSVTEGGNGTQQEATTYLKDAKFKLYKGEKELGTYITDENGKLIIQGLYQYIDGKDEEAIYVLKETLAPEGYAKVKDITFKVDGSTGELKFINTDGTEENYTVDGTTLKLTIEDSPSFKLIKKDAETGARIAGIKFAIYDVSEGVTLAKNSKGEILGTKEIIDGKEYYTVTTDSNGELTADLIEGMYKAVEVQAPDKYDISDSTYYFGIGTSREGKKGIEAIWAQQFGGRGQSCVRTIMETSDGGFLVGGYFAESIKIGNNVFIESESSSGYDGFIIKYNANEEVEWAHGIGGKGYDEGVETIAETSDGGFLVGGYFQTSSISLNDKISLVKSDSYGRDGMLIKYDSVGNAIWAKTIGGDGAELIKSVIETSDGGFLIGGVFSSTSLELENGIELINKGGKNTYGNTCPDIMLIKYNKENNIEWAKEYGGTGDDNFRNVIEDTNGNYVFSGTFSDTINLDDENSLTSKGGSDLLIVKIDKSANVQWAKGCGGSKDETITTLRKCEDGGYLLSGNYASASIELENGETLTNKGYKNSLIVKYNENGEIDFSKTLGAKSGFEILSMAVTSDGGYLICVDTFSYQVDFGNGWSTVASGNYLVKYDKYNQCEWIKKLGNSDQTNSCDIYALAETRDGKYIAGGMFWRKLLLDNDITLENTNEMANCVIIKFEKAELPNPSVIETQNVGKVVTRSVVATKDGGYIIGGYFKDENTILGITNTNNSKAGLLVKYNAAGEVEWINQVRGDSSEEIRSVIETSDGSYVAIGYFSSNKVDLEDGISLTKKGYYSDAMIIKYSNSGNVLWAKSIGGKYSTLFNSIVESEDGGYIVVGNGNSIQLDDGISEEVSGGLILKYSENGSIEWSNGIEDGPTINSIVCTKDGGYAICGSFSGTIHLKNGKTLTSRGYVDGMIIKYNQDGEIEWAKNVGGTDYDIFRSIMECDDGSYIVVGSVDSYTIYLDDETTVKGKDDTDGILLKYSNTGDLKWAKIIGGESHDGISCITATSDGGYVVGGFFQSGMLLENGVTLISDGAYNAMILKYNSSDELEWSKKIGDNTWYSTYSVAECKDGNIAVSVYAGTGQGLSNDEVYIDKLTDGFILKINNQISVPEVQELEVLNKRKEYKITTDVNEIDNIKGGSISGEDLNPYENVKYGETSLNEIKMIPNENYEIIGITVNDEEYKFVKNSDGSYTMPQFTNVTENKHVVVTYALKENKITINKIDKETKEKISGATFKLDQIDERAEPDASKILGSVEKNGEYYFEEKNGSYVSNNQETAGSTANSYMVVDLTNCVGLYELVVNAQGACGSSGFGYADLTESQTAPAYSDGYGRFVYVSSTQDAKDFTMTVQGGKKYYLHFGYYKFPSSTTTDDSFTINSVNILLSGLQLYHTTVETNSEGQAITQIPFGKYSITETKEPDGYWLNETPTIVEFRSTDGAVHEFTIEDEAKAKLIVHHYIKGTTTKLADDENLEAHVGDSYTTNPRLDLDKYELEKDSNGAFVLPANAVGKYKTGTTEVTYYYVEKQIPLTVHHYIEGTTDKVPLKAGGTASDVTGSGKKGESYITSAIADDKLSDEYELIKTPSNASGTYSGNEVVVTYYYKKVARDVNLVKYKEDGKTPLAGARFTIDGQEYITDSNGKITTNLEFGTYDVTETEAPDGYKLPSNPTTKVTITKATPETINITNEKKTGTVTVHHYIEGTTDKVPLVDGGTADDEVKTGNIGDIYATKIVDNLSEGYEISLEPSNGSGTYIDGNIEVIYYYKSIPTSVLVHHYLEGTTTKLVDDVIHDGIVGDNYTTGVAPVDSKYEVVAIPANANGKMTREQIVVIYYYRVKDTSVLVHHYKEGTSESLSKDVTINGKVDDAYTTSVATDIPSKYELVATPTNASGKMTVAQTVVTYYYRLKSTGVDVHYYKEGTTEKVSKDVAIEGKVDQAYTTTPATDVESKYELVGTPTNATGTMTESRITVIYYYRLKDTSVLVHHYLENTTTKLADDVTINGKVDSSYKTVANTDLLAGKYELVAEPANKSGTMTEAQIVVIYYYRVKDTSVLVHHYIKGTTTSLSDDVTIKGKIDDKYTTTVANDIPEQYELVAEPTNKSGTMTEEQIVVTYYYQLKNYPYTVNYLEKETNKVLHDAKQGGELVYGSTVKSSDEKIDIDGYNYDSVDKDTLTIGTKDNVINIYYTKRTDLSYKVNYLEKGTNKVLHEQKVQDGMTFWTIINASDEIIDIEGYNYDSVDKDSIIIGTSNNVINIYYTKRNDLSYKVNYLEKDTNKVLHNQKVQDGMTFESVVNSADEVIDIYGYNYDSVDKETLTITTGENVINIYYTKKDTKVTVHYYEEGTTNKVSEDVEIPGKVFDNYETVSADDVPSKYELVAEPENKNGTMTEDEITVIYYYRKKATQVIVHYYEESTTKKLSEDVTINGRVDDKYTTISATDIPIKYELVATPSNANGSMTEATIEVIYYYRIKDAVVHVRYLEKGTDIVLADPDRIDGKVDDDYQTEAKEIDGYQLVEHTGNEKGKFEVEPLTITYYYLYKTKATVQYIDKITGQILEQSTIEGLEGDNFITESKDFENYVLVEEPPEKTVKMTKEEQILKYYYIHISGGVIEKHIDVISGQILANKTYEGNEGDTYDIPSRTFDGYDLVEDKLPENAKGTMKVEPVEVIYYYIYRSKVTSEYIDKNTGEKLTEDVTQNGHEGDDYTTDRKTFDDYKLVEVPSNADGSMTKDDITVTYYYVHTSGGVIVNHIDIKTGKQLLDETKEEGYEGDPYETHEENIPEYDLVKEKYPENATGKMTIEPTRVTYYYIKKTEVNVKYVDKETGEEIDEPTNIPGHEGDDYTTEPKDVPGYDLIEEPENKDGTMTADPIDVIYYYKRPAKVIVNYYDIDTKEKLADEIEIEGHQNDDYTTEQKDIKYYEIAKVPENKEGKMVVTVTKDENDEEIVDDTTYVNYYYRKLIFNLRVDKTIVSVIVNGQETGINGTLGKVEVHRKNISTANVKVVYKIKVTNDSELSGKANVVENIPSGMTMLSENNPDWTIKETTASLETDEIKPGESREYQVVLGWQNGDNNVGTKTNMVSITTENEADLDEQFETDNVSKADLIVAVGTGEVPYAKIAGGILLIMISITAGVYVISKKRQ